MKNLYLFNAIVVLLILLIVLIYYVWKSNELEKKLKKIKESYVGTIVLADDSSFYLELNDENSVDVICSSSEVLLNVKRDIKTLN